MEKTILTGCLFFSYFFAMGGCEEGKYVRGSAVRRRGRKDGKGNDPFTIEIKRKGEKKEDRTMFSPRETA